MKLVEDVIPITTVATREEIIDWAGRSAVLTDCSRTRQLDFMRVRSTSSPSTERRQHERLPGCRNARWPHSPLGSWGPLPDMPTIAATRQPPSGLSNENHVSQRERRRRRPPLRCACNGATAAIGPGLAGDPRHHARVRSPVPRDERGRPPRASLWIAHTWAFRGQRADAVYLHLKPSARVGEDTAYSKCSSC